MSAGAQENTFWLDARPGSFLSVNRALFFLGEVQVGALREVFEEVEPEEHMPVPDETRNGAEFCLKVRGECMNKVFQDGAVLFCRSYYDQDEELPIDKYIVAVVSSKDTDQIEATTKKLTYNDKGKLVLRPESTNFSHRRDMAIGEDPDTETEALISAVIVGFYKPI